MYVYVDGRQTRRARSPKSQKEGGWYLQYSAAAAAAQELITCRAQASETSSSKDGEIGILD